MRTLSLCYILKMKTRSTSPQSINLQNTSPAWSKSADALPFRVYLMQIINCLICQVGSTYSCQSEHKAAFLQKSRSSSFPLDSAYYRRFIFANTYMRINQIAYNLLKIANLNGVYVSKCVY